MRQDWKLDDGRVVRLITEAALRDLPTGTPLTAIDGENVVVGRDPIDTDTRWGFLAYGKVITSPTEKDDGHGRG